MKLKLELTFLGRTKPELAGARFWDRTAPHDGPPTAEAVGSGGVSDDPASVPIVSWGAGVRAFSYFMLTAFSKAEPLEYRIDGEKGSMASSLTTALHRKKAENSSLTPLQRIFVPVGKQPGTTLERLFHWHANSEVHNYWVRLRPVWRGATIEVHWDALVQKPPTFGALAARIAAETSQVSEPPAAKLGGEARLLVYEQATTEWVAIGQHRLPLNSDSNISIHVAMNRACHVCVAWLTGEGRAQLLHPSTRFQSLAKARSHECKTLDLPGTFPEGDRGGYPLDSGAGRETMLVMARDTPLSLGATKQLESSLRGLAGRFAQFRTQATSDLYEFRYSHEESTLDTGLRLGPPRRLHDARWQMRTETVAALSCFFPFIHAVSFCNAGKLIPPA